MKRNTLLLLSLPMALLVGCQGPPPPAASKEIVVEGMEFKFSPESLEVNVGQPVKLTFKNSGTLEHDFSVIEIPLLITAATELPAEHSHAMSVQPELHLVARSGQTMTLEFTPTTPGRYAFICTVAGHTEAGMKGILVVKAL